MGEHRQALTASEEAVTLHRALAATEPARYTTPELTTCLNNLGNRLNRLGRPDDELAARTEAVAWWARLAQLRPGEFTDTFRGERDALAGTYAERGHPPGAAMAALHEAMRRLEARITET